MKEILRIIFKFFASLFVLLLFFILGSIIYLISVPIVKKRKRLMAVASMSCFAFLKILRVSLTVKNIERYRSEKNWYIMGNHMSYVDILMLLSSFRTLFITSKEMGKKPILGQVCFLGGSFFVERRKITTLKDEIPKIRAALKAGLNICLFPESRCSDGRGLLPFHSGLIEAVVGSGVNVLPLCIMYTEINGRPVKADDFLTIGYFNGMPFPRQFMRLMKQKNLKAEIEILDPVMTEGKERKMIMRELSEKMNSRYDRYLEGRL